MRVTNADGYDEPRDSISHDWLALLASWDMTPVLIPNTGAVARDYLVAQGADILILTGGEDPGTSPVRDQTEIALLEYALETGLPTIGICRGLQLINRHFGGQLARVGGHVATSHSIRLAPPWTDFYGAEATVNSYHNVGISPDGVADALVVMAEDDEGNVEAVRHRDKPLYAVMWHPERQPPNDGDRRLFRNLLASRGQRT